MIRFAITVLTVVVGFSAPGCGERPVQPLRVGLLVWPAYEMPYLAARRGYLDTDQVQLVEYHSPAEVLRAYEIEGLDVIAITSGYALQMADRDPDQRIVMVIDESFGGDALLARPEIESLAELRGQRIGIERSALGVYMLTRALEHGGLDRGEVVVQSTDVPESVDAFEAGRFDAVVTYEPYRTQILGLGARELFSSRDIPGEIIDVVLTRREVIEEYRAPLAQLIDGWLAVAEQLPALSDAEIEYLAARENLSGRQYVQALDSVRLSDRADNRRLLSGPSPAMLTHLQRHAEVMLSEGLIEKRPDLALLVDGRFHDTPP